MIIIAVDDNLVDGSVTAIDISSKISLPDAIFFLARSWRLVKHGTITNCFYKGGFGTLAESVVGTNKEPVLPEVTNVDGYLNIDKDLQCFEESNSNYDDDIIEGIISKRACLQDSSEELQVGT